jgi:hypothetical protein
MNVILTNDFDFSSFSCVDGNVMARRRRECGNTLANKDESVEVEPLAIPVAFDASLALRLLSFIDPIELLALCTMSDVCGEACALDDGFSSPDPLSSDSDKLWRL